MSKPTDQLFDGMVRAGMKAAAAGRILTGAEALDAARDADPALYAEATREVRRLPADGSAPGRLLAAMAARPGLTGAQALDAIRESDPALYAEAVAGYGSRSER